MAQDVADRAPGLDDKVRVRVVDVPDDAAARAALTDEEADAWLTPGADGWVLVGRDEVPRNLEEVTATVVRDTHPDRERRGGRHDRRRHDRAAAS